MNFSPAGVITLLVLIPVTYVNRQKAKQFIDSMIIVSVIAGIAVEVGYVVQLFGLSLGFGTFFMMFTLVVFFIDTVQKKNLRRWLFDHKRYIIIFTVLYVYIAASLFIKQTFFLGGTIKLMSFGFLDSMYMLADSIQNKGINRWSIKALVMLPVWGGFTFILTDRVEDHKFINKVRKSVYISVIVILLVQCVELYVNYAQIYENGFRDVVIFLFGETRGMWTETLTRFNLLSSYALFNEPSHLAILYLILYTCVLFDQRNQKLKLTAVLLSVSSILLSGGTTPFILIMVFVPIIIYTYILKLKFRHRVIAVSAIVLLLLLCIPFLNSVFHEVADKFLSYTGLSTYSPNTRMGHVFNASRIFLQNPLFGIGINTYRCGMIMFTLISNLGIIGVVLYYYYLYDIIKPAYNKIQFLYALWVIFFWLFFISVPFGGIYAAYFPFFFLTIKTSPYRNPAV